MKTCHYCESENPESAMICRHCLRPLQSPDLLVNQTVKNEKPSKTIECPACGSENDLNNIFCSKCGFHLTSSKNGSNKPSSNAKSQFFLLDIISIFLISGIYYVYSLPIYPNQTVQLAIWNSVNDVKLYMISELISGIAVIAAFFLSLISILFLRNHPRISGFLWLIIVIGISAHPVIALIQMANQSSYTYDLFNKGFLYVLLLSFPIFLFSLVKIMYRRKNE